MRYPEFLSEGGIIGFVAPSFGCATEPYKTAFGMTIKRFEKEGYTVELGPNCYEDKGIGISNTPQECGKELTQMYESNVNDVLISCGGGELMCEILPYVDFDRIKAAKPKWYLGYSDNTNFTFLQNTIADTASVYGPCAGAFAMKDGVKILNFARDVLVNDEDMKAALDSGKVAKYMTDFPNPAIAGYKNVVAFPHLGASTAESEDNCAVMACKEIKAYINDGNIKNSVNYPNVNMGQCSDVARVTICHKNIPNMLTQFTGVFSKKGGNVSGMISKAKGDYAYSILDIGVEPTADDIAELSAIEGVVKVRVIK